MKKLLLLFTFISLTYVGLGQNHFIESFENPDSWPGYTTGTVNFDSGDWEFVGVYPETSGDSYDGSKACRINDDVAGASITSPSVNGVGTISFYYHRPFGGSGSFELQKSVGGGAYNILATVDYSSVTTPAEYTYDVNDASNNIKIRIVNDDNSAHLTIDYFTMGEAGGNASPDITNISISPALPTSSDDVTVSADVTDTDGTINNVELNWGTISGSLGNTINMSITTGDTYETDTDIPAQSDGTTVYYEIAATDDEPETTTSAEQSYDINDPATLPYSENFTGQNGKGATGGSPVTYDLTGVDWTLDINESGLTASSDWFRVENEEFSARDIDEEQVWNSPVIDISGETDIDITIDVSSVTGELESSDYIETGYVLDGGSFTTITKHDGEITGTVTDSESLTGLSNSTLKIVIKVLNGAGSEYYYFDNISVEAASTLPEPTNHVTSFTATANGHDQIDLSWNDNDGAQAADGFLIKANTSGSFTDPSDGTDPTEDTDLSDGTALVKVDHGVESHSFTGLSETTQYIFKIWPYTNSGSDIDFKTDGTVPTDNATTGAAPSLPNAWINEIHYDNDGSDVNEMLEIVIENAGSHTLADFEVTLYNGSGGSEYGAETIDNFTSGDSEGNYKFYTWLPSSIQNGPDGLALSYGGTLIQFLSYEGSFTATDGVANGETSSDIGVEESGSTLSTESLQLTGIGTEYSDFTWQIPATATAGSLNNEQYFEVDVTWDGGASTTFWNDANNWSNDAVPNSGSNITIGSGSDVEIATSNNASCNDLIVDGSLTIKSDDTGTGSLIINGTASGDITSERYILGYSPSLGDGWHLLASPVANQEVDGTSFEPEDGVDDFYAWDENNYIWENHDQGGLTQFNAGEGYLVAYENTTTHQFTGTPNTADETETLTYTDGQGEGWNLLGNPFQSALSWDDGNWTLGDVQATAKIYDENDGNYDDIQSGSVDIIPANQGFFVKTNAAGTLTIPKAARVHDGTTFYKNTRASGGFLELRIEAEENTFADEFTVWSNEGASDGYDSYDSEKFYGNAEAPQFYGVVNDDTYSTVSYQPAAIEDSRMVNLSLEAPEGEYNMGINSNTLASGTEIYIEDLLTDELIDMNETELLSIIVSENDPAERFVLHLNSTSVSNETLGEENSVKIYASNQQLYIDSENMIDDGKVTVYNTIGQVVAKEEMNGNTLSLNINERGTYIVTVRSDEGVSTRKVVIQ